MTIQDIKQAVEAFGPGASIFLAFVLVLGYFEVWVWGRTHRRVIAEMREWRRIALRGTRAAADALEVADQ